MARLSLRQRLNPARFLRGEGPQAGPITLDRRRVFILPSRSGLVFGLILLAMLFGAINYNNSLAYLLTFLLASLTVVSILHTYRNLSALRFSGGRCTPVFAGEPMRFRIGLDNTSPQERLAITLTLPDGPAQTLDVAAGNIRWVELSRLARQRGYAAMGRFTVETRFPLGLFRAWAHLDLDQHCLVYPKPAPEPGLPPAISGPDSGSGDRGIGHDDFAALRGYHPGDSLRHVHWKAVAKEQGMLTKQFGGEQAEELSLTWELAGGDTESRLSRLCRWVLEADAQGLVYTLSLPDARLGPDLGERHRRRCLEALALFGVKR